MNLKEVTVLRELLGGLRQRVLTPALGREKGHWYWGPASAEGVSASVGGSSAVSGAAVSGAATSGEATVVEAAVAEVAEGEAAPGKATLVRCDDDLLQDLLRLLRRGAMN